MLSESLLAAIEWRHVLGTTPLEIAATVCAVAGVFLIARQNIAGWPLGLIWAAISAYLAFTSWQVVSDGVLYVSYIPMQIYCWAVWARRGNQATVEEVFVPTWLPRSRQIALGIAAAVSVVAWGFAIIELKRRGWIQPKVLWIDSTTTVLNYYAQFLQARKRMENWIGWLIVNVLGMYVYWVVGSPIYSVQYGFFLILGLYGWRQWSRTRREHERQTKCCA